MHFVGHVDWSFADDPMPPSDRSSGLARRVLVGPAQGAVHTELAVGALHPGGWLQRHVHSYEEALYVLQGELLLDHDGRVHRLVKGDFALNPLSMWHGLGNDGDAQVRWLSVNTPQRLGPEMGRKDTYFAKGPADLGSLSARAVRPAFGPSLRYVGHYEGTPPQAEALRLADPARGRAPVGMDTALIVYSGISVKMLVDRVFGADLLTMFTVDYEPDGSAQQHDHPFEEAYFFLEGEIEAELDGAVYQVKAGDVVFSAVGGVHGFYNNGARQVRWIETQAPQPPARHAYRWLPTWQKFEEENDVE
jgi:quercetin dioxygenase-like cupin family protein